MMSVYHPRPYAGTVTVFRARTLSLKFRGSAGLGWERLAAHVTTHLVPGAHDTILKEPRVRQLAAKLSAALHACSAAV
jgi:thioesterase domain-containing protein